MDKDSVCFDVGWCWSDPSQVVMDWQHPRLCLCLQIQSSWRRRSRGGEPRQLQVSFLHVCSAFVSWGFVVLHGGLALQATFLKQGESTGAEETRGRKVGRSQVLTGFMDKLGVWLWWNGRGRCTFPPSSSLLKLLRCPIGGQGVTCNGKSPLVLRRKPPDSNISPWEWCSPDTASQRGCGISTLGVLRDLV